MEKICQELDETKAELEKLRLDYRSKNELSENLKRAHNEQIIKLQEADSKLQKQAAQLNENAEEVSSAKRMYEDVKAKLIEKESIIRHLTAANEKIRGDFADKYHTLEKLNQELVFALDEANEKNIDQEQKINVLRAEMEGLKGRLSVFQNKCLEAEKKANVSKKLKEKDNVLLKLEDDSRVFEDKLKWKSEQFKHLEEAHMKLRDEFKTAKELWEREKSTLIDEICSLQTNLDSQLRISEDLQNKLKRCNQALAHEETRRKFLDVEVAKYKTRFDDVLLECEDAKSQLECMTEERDKEIAALRHSLGTKETYYKEVEYRAGNLERENQELLTSLKELQETQIQHHAGGSSLGKLRSKLKSLEHIHRECSANLQAKEAEWSSQLSKTTADLNNCKTELEAKDAAIEELKNELETCNDLVTELTMQNEESSVMLMVLKSEIFEAQLKLTDGNSKMAFCNEERDETISEITKQLEIKDAALAKAQKDFTEELEKQKTLWRRIESFDNIEQQQLVMQKEIDMYKEMLEESSRCQSRMKEQAMQMERESKEKVEEQLSQMENDSKRKLKEMCDALDTASSELAAEREKAAMLSTKLELLDNVEEEKQNMQKELENYKELLEESFKCQLRLEEKALEKESDANQKLKQVSDALAMANNQAVQRMCEQHEIEFELWIWKSIAERFKTDLEEIQGLRKEIEASLLAEMANAQITKHEKDDLSNKLQEKECRISYLQQQIVSLQQQLKETEKDKLLENLEKEIEWLEQESFRRELEGAVFTQIWSEGKFENERRNLAQLVEEKDRMIDDLLQRVRSLEEKVHISLNSFSSQIVEKQMQINLIYKAWEKIAAASILAKVEMEEKILMISEMEDEIRKIEKKLEFQKNSLSWTEERAAGMETELEAKKLQMKTLTEQMDAELRNSDSLVNELKNEKRNLVGDSMKLLSFIESTGEKINEISNEDSLLMGTLGNILQSLNINENDKSWDELSMKENMNRYMSPGSKNREVAMERSPFSPIN
ncbi:hypothetical protein ACFE04_021057 [Oxalis oulophora]